MARGPATVTTLSQGAPSSHTTPTTKRAGGCTPSSPFGRMPPLPPEEPAAAVVQVRTQSHGYKESRTAAVSVHDVRSISCSERTGWEVCGREECMRRGILWI
eukprot:CAMPEP_0205889322 /NCGR_PEP_ID=MMETSP1083-20121108/20892_1 /ASSEMBLY_ACC=CAM_ASM_000430 /TAXON_ID=97485 /ORGANISM="Prymnesium parvum, Strain Texoma1" /LENGTH=101 /DNA_ID=CAMNT_0053253387 /DNA_START=70 /DNA_END=375 /DNA_ORIENTATION=+